MLDFRFLKQLARDCAVLNGRSEYTVEELRAVAVSAMGFLGYELHPEKSDLEVDESHEIQSYKWKGAATDEKTLDAFVEFGYSLYEAAICQPELFEEMELEITSSVCGGELSELSDLDNDGFPLNKIGEFLFSLDKLIMQMETVSMKERDSNEKHMWTVN